MASTCIMSAVGAAEASPTRQGWETNPSDPKRRRCDTILRKLPDFEY